ncbi:hypothetical protein RND81_02G080800 [Saponaria officinalis]|uniref:Uncharacterized protein n=1 Tax=Saponaria officinalis TaxID=3572 RepID=A0AAW1MR35_SAPOF
MSESVDSKELQILAAKEPEMYPLGLTIALAYQLVLSPVELTIRYLCLDEADRLVDLGFEDDVREVFDHFKALVLSHNAYKDSELCQKCTEVEAGAVHSGKDQERVHDKIVLIWEEGCLSCHRCCLKRAEGVERRVLLQHEYINRNQSETTLLDLKHLLQEAKQRIPPVLAELDDQLEEAEPIASAD